MGQVTPLSDWRKQAFLEWLCTIQDDRDPSTLGGFAEKIGSTTQTLRNWKRDPEFLAEWEHRYRLTVGSPEKAHTVVEQLYETARDRTDPRQVQAARAFLEAIDAIKPKKVDVTVTRSPRELTDEQLIAIAAQNATAALEERGVS